MQTLNTKVLNDLDDVSSLNNDLDGGIVHVRVHQRRARQYITTIEGLDRDLDIKKLLRYMKKIFNCNGTVRKESTMNNKSHSDQKITTDYVLLLQGDHRDKVKKFFISEAIVPEKQIKVHGF